MKYKHLLSISLVGLSMAFATTTFAEEHEVGQENKKFRMGSKIIKAISIRVGDTIRFKNGDPFFHNIFSLSDLKTFDLGSFPIGESKRVTFDKAGMVEVECAIHPEMFLEVTIK